MSLQNTCVGVIPLQLMSEQTNPLISNINIMPVNEEIATPSHNVLAKYHIYIMNKPHSFVRDNSYALTQSNALTVSHLEDIQERQRKMH